MPKLGRRMYTQNYVLRGCLDDHPTQLDGSAWKAFLIHCVAAMGMTTAGEAAVWSYPTDDGKGGEGMTVCQPMTESFIVVDTWPAHDGAYLHVSSCRKFDPSSLIEPVRAAGLAIDFVGAFEALRL